MEYTYDVSIVTNGITNAALVVNNQLGSSAHRLLVGTTLYAPPSIDGTERTFLNTGTNQLVLMDAGLYSVQPFSDSQWFVDFRIGASVANG